MKSAKELRSLEPKALIEQAKKNREQVVEEVAKLANQGRKNSIVTKKLRREIAQIETIINEKIIESFEG